MTPGKFTYYTIYDFMSADPILHGATKEVFALVYAVCVVKNGPGEVSIGFVERLTGLARQTIVDCLRALTRVGYIERVGEGKRCASIYVVKKYYPPPTSQETGLVQRVDQSILQTSQKSRLVKNSDRSRELTSDQSTPLTSTSPENGPNIIYKKITERNPQLFIKEEFVGKSTI